MKPTELRIGNLFRDKHSGDIFPVLELKKDTIVFDYENYGVWQAEPIPVTPELSEQLDFERNGDYASHRLLLSSKKETKLKTYLVIAYDGDCWIDLISDVWEPKEMQSCCFFERVKHLHQLQNLVYSLTGSELTLPLLDNKQQ